MKELGISAQHFCFCLTNSLLLTISTLEGILKLWLEYLHSCCLLLSTSIQTRLPFLSRGAAGSGRRHLKSVQLSGSAYYKWKPLPHRHLQENLKFSSAEPGRKSQHSKSWKEISLHPGRPADPLKKGQRWFVWVIIEGPVVLPGPQGTTGCWTKRLNSLRLGSL